MFDENLDAVSIRNTEEYCLDGSFFKKGYLIKYPGIPITCKKCKKDFLHHLSYHLDFHEHCKFCRIDSKNMQKHQLNSRVLLKSNQNFLNLFVHTAITNSVNHTSGKSMWNLSMGMLPLVVTIVLQSSIPNNQKNIMRLSIICLQVRKKLVQYVKRNFQQQ